MALLVDFSDAGHGTDGEGGLKSIVARQDAVKEKHAPCANIKVSPIYLRAILRVIL